MGKVRANRTPKADQPVLAEPIHILSDLHLGHPSCRIENIGDLEADLAGASTAVFNGDTYEERIPEIQADSDRSLAELKTLCADLGVEPIFLTGNHDPEISDLHYLELCGGNVFVTHGDLLFPKVTPWSREIQEITKKLDEVHAAFGPELDHDLEIAIDRLIKTRAEIGALPLVSRRRGLVGFAGAVLREMFPPTRIIEILGIWNSTPRLARELLRKYRPEGKTIVIGHTHRGHDSTSPQGVRVINTGTFAAGFGRRVVRIEDGKVS